MIEKTMTVYICEHCRKLYQIKRFAEWHVKHCKKNPDNKHKCFEWCDHLEKIQDEHEYECGNIPYTVFICKKTGEEMFSYIAERRQLDVSGERMPLECEHYEDTANLSGNSPSLFQGLKHK